MPSTRAGRARWAPGVRAFVEHLKQPDAATGRPYATRYSASLVGDVHRFLLEGGIYLYPADVGAARRSRSCGSSTSAIPSPSSSSRPADARRRARRVLDVVPDSLHARIPLAIGSRTEVELFERFASA